MTPPLPPTAGEVTVDGREVTLPFAGAELSIRRASSTFLLLQTPGAHILWGLETPTTYVTLQPTFAGKVSPVPDGGARRDASQGSRGASS